MPDTRRLVTKKEAARLLGCSLRTVERRIEAGALATGPPLHTRHGAATRVYVDAPAGAPPTADAPPSPDDDPGVAGVVAASQGTDSRATLPATVPVSALLSALADSLRERDALATRLGEERAQRRQAEAERDALRAQLDKQAREEDTARPGALQRAWRAFRRKGGE